MIDIWIAGKPHGKERPRFANGRTYTPKKTENAEANVVAVWREAGEPRMSDGPISIVIIAQVERPAGHFNSKGDLNAQGQRHPYPEKQKPDLDNLAKLIMDALNGRAYKDDVRVVDLVVRRRWHGKSGVRVIINEMD